MNVLDVWMHNLGMFDFSIVFNVAKHFIGYNIIDICNTTQQYM